MCKACELKGITMDLRPLDPNSISDSEMPESWHGLIEKNFYPDLVLRCRAHMAWSKREDELSPDKCLYKNARAFVSAMGKGFTSPFVREPFEPKKGCNFFDLKKSGLDAICELAMFYGDRVSMVAWDAFAHLATRENPEEKKSILKERNLLPHHYGIVDCMYHSTGKVYTLMMHIQSVFYKHTGMILVHNCDCNCSLLNLKKVSGVISFALDSAEEITEATQSLFTHQLAESHLILNDKLPFEYSITKEAMILFGKE